MVKVFIFAPAKRKRSLITERHFFRLEIYFAQRFWKKSLKKVVKKFGGKEKSFYLCTRNSNEVGWWIDSEYGKKREEDSSIAFFVCKDEVRNMFFEEIEAAKVNNFFEH